MIYLRRSRLYFIYLKARQTCCFWVLENASL